MQDDCFYLTRCIVKFTDTQDSTLYCNLKESTFFPLLYPYAENYLSRQRLF